MSKEKPVYIYALVDPITELVRYVGKSPDPKMRFNTHVHRAKSHNDDNPHKCNWIRSLLQKNLLPKLEIIETASDSSWEDAERKWIRYFRENGHRPTNVSDGGDHVSPIPVGSKCATAKFTESDIIKIREMYSTGEFSQPELAKIFETSQSNIGRIINGETWSHVPLFPKPTPKKNTPVGDRAGGSKLTNKDATLIRTQFANSSMRIKDFAQIYNVSEGTIENVLNGSTYKTADGPTVPLLYKRKLNQTQVREIRQLIENGEISKTDIAKMYNISPATITDIRAGSTWNKTDDEPKRTGYATGENAGMSKLTSQQVVEIRDLHTNGLAYTEIATRYKVTTGATRKIVTRQNWKHIT